MNINNKAQNKKISLAQQLATSIESQINELQKIARQLARYNRDSSPGNGHNQVTDGVEGKPQRHRSSCNNPLPRAQRLRPTYLGNPADFERTPAIITPELRKAIKQTVALPLSQVIRFYGDGLQLRPYTHPIYKFCATIHQGVAGTPARRYFATLQDAVTWLEIIRARRKAGNLKHNLPLGGVRRDAFQMSWEKKRHDLANPQPGTPPKPSRSKPWSAQRHAQRAETAKAKRAYRSINPLAQTVKVRPRATTEQVLGIPAPMPGNNVETASLTGSTAASSQSQLRPDNSHNSQAK